MVGSLSGSNGSELVVVSNRDKGGVGTEGGTRGGTRGAVSVVVCVSEGGGFSMVPCFECNVNLSWIDPEASSLM